ncbi:uncharacterized protein gjz1 [Hypanus sabinus]|uniref:uncharacterized protein gjz1 n=1 Tax=Hypanus sabinus TaxID=79690 RepID=UPI0028C37CB6|nr:uncharacterized protein gjz1 [Hypanus sabinus]
MAAIVAYSRLAAAALGSLGSRQGMAPWLGLLGLRLASLLVAGRAWTDFRSDFICNATLGSFCDSACFDARFSFPMSSAWDLGFLLVVLPVGCLYLLSPPIVGSTLGHGGSPPPAALACCSLALALVEGGVLGLMAGLQLPQTWPGDCQLPAICAKMDPSGAAVHCWLEGWAEKVGAMAALGFTSALNLLAGLLCAGAMLLGQTGRQA